MLSSEQAHVLLIDDEPERLGPLPATLRAQGWRISLATDGYQGFHRAQAVLPDLILLDLFMPRLDGFATCRLLQEAPRTREIPIIFLTSSGDDEQRLKGLQNGGVDYVVKPFLPEEVVARIRIHLQRSPRRSPQPPGHHEPSLTQSETLLRATQRFINDNLSDLPPLVDIAHEVGTHDKKLSAIFRKHVGMTVFAWAREERLRVASEWLADSHMEMADIAAQIGFHSAANFATAFRHHSGITPSQYRHNLRANKTDPDPDPDAT